MRLFKKKKCSKSSVTQPGDKTSSVIPPTRKESTTSTASTSNPQSSISSHDKRYKFRYGTTNEASKYGYGDEMSWGEFGVGADTCPVQVDRRKILVERMSSMRQLNSNCDSVPSNQQQTHRPTRRRSSIHFGEGNSSMGDSSSGDDTYEIKNTQRKGSDCKGSRQQRRRRSSITGANPTLEYATQYGEEEPWMTFGHAKPYSADELLAAHNISLPNETTISNDAAKQKSEDVHTQSQQAPPEDMAKYDYGDASPDSAAPGTDIYGYGEAAPDSHHKNDEESIKQLYGYDDTLNPSSVTTSSSRRGTRRRSTIQHIGKQELDEFDRKGSRQSQRRQRGRRSSVTGAEKPKPRKHTSTQYGDDAPWKVFGHAEPYSAEEYLAKFDVQIKDLSGSEEFSRKQIHSKGDWKGGIDEGFRAFDTIAIAN